MKLPSLTVLTELFCQRSSLRLRNTLCFMQILTRILQSLLLMLFIIMPGIALGAPWVITSDNSKYTNFDTGYANITWHAKVAMLDTSSQAPVDCADGCLIGLLGLSSDGSYLGPLRLTGSIKVKGTTMGKLLSMWKESVGLVDVEMSCGFCAMPASKWCTTIGITPNGSEKVSIGHAYAGSIDGCVPVPPPNVTCSVQLPAEINFGDLNVSKIEGAEKSVTMEVSCSAGTSEIYVDISPKPLDLGNGVISNFFIDGKAVANAGALRLPLKGKTISLPFTARLSADKRVTPGNLQGNVIVIVDPL